MACLLSSLRLDCSRYAMEFMKTTSSMSLVHSSFLALYLSLPPFPLSSSLPSLSFSPSLPSLSSQYIDLLCSSSDTTRSSSVTLVRNLSRQSSDPEVCVAVCQYLIDMLTGKGNTLSGHCVLEKRFQST